MAVECGEVAFETDEKPSKAEIQAKKYFKSNLGNDGSQNLDHKRFNRANAKSFGIKDRTVSAHKSNKRCDGEV